MQIELKYGHSFRHLAISDKADVVFVQPSVLPVLPNVAQLLDRALDKPLHCQRLEDMEIPKSVSIAVPDETRPTPVKMLLPVLIKRLYKFFQNLKPKDVTIVIGGGLHSPMDHANIHRIIPPNLIQNCRIVVHDANSSPMVDFGMTSRSTPVSVNAVFSESELKLVIGQIDPHQFVGFTGGAKVAVIGCGAAKTIEGNHSLMFDERAWVGRLEGNPVREDIDEAGRMLGVKFAINVLLDPNKNVVGLWVGDPVSILKKAARMCAELYGAKLDKKFDIVVASCGGYPKDVCLYQAQKGLNLASHALKPKGKLLLLAACPQGVGDSKYYDYTNRFNSPEEVITDFEHSGFKMGAHKSYLFARTSKNFEVVIDSDLNRETLNRCQLMAGRAQETINQWIERFPGKPRVAVIPNANTTYFYDGQNNNSEKYSKP